jgi:hypothetical protein
MSVCSAEQMKACPPSKTPSPILVLLTAGSVLMKRSLKSTRPTAAPSAKPTFQCAQGATRPSTPSQSPYPNTRSGFVGGGISTPASFANPKRA